MNTENQPIEAQAVALMTLGKCVDWKFSTTGGKWGRGVINIGTKKQPKQAIATRAIWEVNVGPIPKGLWVLHRCDNPQCVNPWHLFLGTPKDNTLDAWKKGRLPPIPPHRGTDNPKHKLTEEDVKAIRLEYSKGGVRQVDLAKRYGVIQVTISRLLRKTAWRHL